MHIRWLCFGDLDVGPRGYGSQLAAMRYRALVPAVALGRLGHRVELVRMALDVDPRTAVGDGSADVLVCSRVVPREPAEFAPLVDRSAEVLRLARAAGSATVLDVNDRIGDVGPFADRYAALVGAAGVLVAGTEAQAVVVRGWSFAAPVHVVGDPCEGDEGAALFAPPPPRAGAGMMGALRRLAGGATGQRALRLLWYGHERNLLTVIEALPAVRELAGERDVELSVVTSPGCGAEDWCEAVNRKSGDGLRLRFVAWSVEATFEELARCDIVLLPSDPAADFNAVKTANRLIEAVRAGRCVVASALPAYAEFADAAWTGDDLLANLRRALRQPRDTLNRIRRGQALVRERYSPDAIARQWEAAFVDAADGGDPEAR